MPRINFVVELLPRSCNFRKFESAKAKYLNDHQSIQIDAELTKRQNFQVEYLEDRNNNDN